MLLEENKTFIFQNSRFSRFLKKSQETSAQYQSRVIFISSLSLLSKRESQNYHFLDKSECIFFTVHFSNFFSPFSPGRVLSTWVSFSSVSIERARREKVQNVGLSQVSHVSLTSIFQFCSAVLNPIRVFPKKPVDLSNTTSTNMHNLHWQYTLVIS